MPEGQDAPVPPAPPPGDESTPAGDLGITVALDQFSGPMDLLLYLVRRAEVDIKDLPVTTIADQFAAWVSAAAGTTLDLEAAGDFVVMAATLLEIKARMVAPPPEGTEVPDDGEDAFDPRSGLIRKLLVYRAAKEAAFDLDHRDDLRRLRHHRGHREVVPDDAAEVDAWELKDVGAGTLANLWFDLLKRIDGLGPRTVLVDDVPMGVRMAQLVEDMRARGEGRLSELFAIDSGPIARVGIVMAVLECTRQRLLRVGQEEQYGDIRIRFRAEDDRAIAVGDPGPPEQLPKRQRRPPLVTWTGTSAPEGGEDGEPTEEATVENEEQRFLRELESSVGVERLLARAANLEKGFISWWEETHPGEPLPPGVVKPEPPPPPPPPPPVVEAKPEVAPRPKRQPKPPAQPAAETAAPAAPPTPETPATPPAVAPVAAAETPPEAPDVPVAMTPVIPDPAPASLAPPDPAPIVTTAPSFEVVPLSPAAPAPDPVVAAAIPQPTVEAPPAVAVPSDVEPGARASARDEPADPPADAEPAPVADGTVVSEPPTSTDAVAVSEPVAADAPPDAVNPFPAFTAAEPVPQAIASDEPAIVAQEHVAALADPEPAPAVVALQTVAAAALPASDLVADEPVADEPVSSDQPVSPVADQAAPATIASVAAAPEPTATIPEPASIEAPAVTVLVADPPVVEASPVAVASVVASAPSEPPPAAVEPESEPEPIAATPPPAPPPDPLPPPPETANTPPAPAPTSTPNLPSKPTPMSRPRHLKTAALAALWVLSTVALVAWFQRPAQVLAVNGPNEAVVSRDGELAWTLNLALDPETRATAELPAVEPAGAGSVAWRDDRTCVFTPNGALPAAGVLTVRFGAGLRAKGGFRFDPEALPSMTVRTLPALAVTGLVAGAPAFGDGWVDVALNRVPADSAALFAAVAVSPAVPVTKQLVDGRLRLSGPFVPGTTYAVTVADTAPGRADDRPLAWQGDVAVPARTPGARLATQVGRQAIIEAVNTGFVIVENAAGQCETLRFSPAVGDVPARAELPGWMLVAGENRLRLRWPGGEREVVLGRHDLPLTPDDGAPALLCGTLPVVSAR